MQRFTGAHFLVMTIALGLFLAAPLSHADAMDIPATGQSLCYDSAGNAIACLDTGMDGETRGGVLWPDPRFVVNADTSIVDNLTGLSWAPDGSTPDVGACTGGYLDWDEQLAYVACLNGESYLGHDDWRMPNIRELASLVNVGYSEQDCQGSPCESVADWLVEQGFSGLSSTTKYWSSTTEGSYSGNSAAYGINMDIGTWDLSYKVNGKMTWPVRGTATDASGLAQTANDDCSYNNSDPRDCTGTGADGDLQEGIAWPVPRFTENADATADFAGTVTDNLTGFVWLKDANCIDTKYDSFDSDCSAGDGLVEWANALAFVTAMNAGTYPNCSGGYTDWRLPNLRELWSLAEFSTLPVNDPLPTGHPFLNPPPGSTWTSTTIVEFLDPLFVTAHAWAVSFTDGNWTKEYKDDCNPIWPVRGGVKGEPDIAVSAAIDLGDVEVGAHADANIVISNEGTNFLFLGEIAGSDPVAAPFRIIDDPCSNTSVAPGENCTMIVRFEPSTAGEAQDSFNIPTNDPNDKIVLVSLSGTGTSAAVDPGTTGGDEPTAPEACGLVFPTDDQDGFGSEVTLIWKKATDVADPVYDLDVCESEDFAGCSTIEDVAFLRRTESVMRFASTWLKSLVIGPFMLAGCGGSAAPAVTPDDNTPSVPELGDDEMSYTVTGLKPATTYFWKVTVHDGTASTSSAIQRFTTK